MVAGHSGEISDLEDVNGLHAWLLPAWPMVA